VIAVGAWFGLGLLTAGRDEAAAGGTEAILSVQTPAQTGAEPEAMLDNGRAVEEAALDEYMWQGESRSEPFPPKLHGFLPLAPGTPLEMRRDGEPDRTWVFLADPMTFRGIEGTAGVAADVARTLFDVAPGRYVLVIQESWGCKYDSPSATSCFVTGERSQHQSLLTFYFGVRVTR